MDFGGDFCAGDRSSGADFLAHPVFVAGAAPPHFREIRHRVFGLRRDFCVGGDIFREISHRYKFIDHHVRRGESCFRDVIFVRFLIIFAKLRLRFLFCKNVLK